MPKHTPRTHRNFVNYSNEKFLGFSKNGSLVERNALANASKEEETHLEPEQLQEIEDKDYLTPLYNKILPETPNGITQDDIIDSLEHGNLPGGFTFEDFIEYVNQDDLDT